MAPSLLTVGNMDSDTRKRVLRSLSNGMYVITGQSSAGFGAATVTWLTQTSFEPPLLVAGVRPASGLFACLTPGSPAVVHVVGKGQEGLAKRFFSRPEVDTEATPPTIAGLPFSLSGAGLPILDDCDAYAECTVSEIIDHGGDHELVVLEVVDVTSRDELVPLTVRASPWEYGG